MATGEVARTDEKGNNPAEDRVSFLNGLNTALQARGGFSCC